MGNNQSCFENNDHNFNKDEFKKNDVFGYGPIDMKIKVMNEIILILQCKIIVLLFMCYP